MEVRTTQIKILSNKNEELSHESLGYDVFPEQIWAKLKNVAVAFKHHISVGCLKSYCLNVLPVLDWWFSIHTGIQKQHNFFINDRIICLRAKIDSYLLRQLLILHCKGEKQ